MIYHVLFLLLLSSLSDGCAPHSPKHRPPRPQPPITPKICPKLAEDTSCTDCEQPPTNSETEIMCPATGNTLMVLVDGSNMKKGATEAKCDSATGKWVFKKDGSAVNIEAKKVYCTTECALAGNCGKPCTALTAAVDSCITLFAAWETQCEAPAVNTLEEVTCPTTGNNVIFVVDAADQPKEVTEAKCDSATGEWAFKKDGNAVEIEATKVFCSQECSAAGDCPIMPCPQLSDAAVPAICYEGDDPWDCKEPEVNTPTKIECPSMYPRLYVGDKSGEPHPATAAVCNAHAGQWIFKQGENTIDIVPNSVFCLAA